MQFNERVLKIIDTFESGSKLKFASKTGAQVYNLLKPDYKPRKATFDRILKAYPQVSEEWLLSDIGDMVSENADVQNEVGGEKKIQLAELPDNATAHQVLSWIMKYSETYSTPKLSVKLNMKLNELNSVYNEKKPMS